MGAPETGQAWPVFSLLKFAYYIYIWYNIIKSERETVQTVRGVMIINHVEDKARKTFVLDTSVLVSSPYAINAFDEHNVVIPMCVLQSMRAKMGDYTGDVRANATEVFKLIDTIAQGEAGSLRSGIQLGNGGTLRIDGESGSQTICDVAKSCNGIVVSRDPAIRILAKCAGVAAEDYRAEAIENPLTGGYTGRCKLHVSHEEMMTFAKDDGLRPRPDSQWYATTAEDAPLPANYSLTANEFVTLVDSSNPTSTMIGRWDKKEGKIVPLRFYSKKYPVCGVQARNIGQSFALEALMAPASIAPLVILQGPAGTAKTFLSMAAALEQSYYGTNYRRVLATRSNTEMDKTLGYLKGDEVQKLTPLLRPIFDNVENLHKMSQRKGKKDDDAYGDPVQELLACGAVTIQSMGYMRGRSIADTYIIIDEAQNMSLTQVLSMITRAGEGSKIVLLGDPDQIDSQFLDKKNNGLVFAAEKMKGSELCWQLSFLESECTRSPLAKEAIRRLTPKGAVNIGRDI